MAEGVQIDLARLRKAILDHAGPGKRFTRRGLSMLATDGRNPDLVRDIMRVDKRKPTIESVSGIASALDIPLSDLIKGVVARNDDVKEWLTVSGTVAAGVWREQPEWGPDDWFQIEVGPSPIEGKRTGLLVEGRSMDRTFPPGTILDCVDLIESGAEIADGDYVIVERRNGSLLETTCKRLSLRPDGDWELVAESTLREFDEPLFIGRPDFYSESEDEVRVKAVVVWAHRQTYRPRRRRMPKAA